MGVTEFLATAAAIGSVFLAVKRSVWQFPVGLASTALFFFVFWHVRLYSSAGLQVVFTAIQFYGWWYWLRGDRGKKPRITSWPAWVIVTLCIAAGIFAAGASYLLNVLTNAVMSLPDSAIFGLSVAAQFLLDRKKIETWIVWGFVNILSVWVYASQELWITTTLYVGLFFNVFWGYWEWRQEIISYQTDPIGESA